MFSIYPDEWPGAGLLFLRMACGVVLLCQANALLQHAHELDLLTWAFVVVAIAAGLLLVIGLLTRVAALSAAIISAGSCLSLLPRFNGPLHVGTTAVLSAIIGFAVLCLGPGAVSLDSRLFGRREVIIPGGSTKS
jgi:uncharacterized membrane protein YphA (DoxX/SURF4 family)